MRIAVAGSSGLIGTALMYRLRADGHEPIRLLRHQPPLPEAGNDIVWDPARGELDAQALTGLDAVINLCGSGVGDGRWTARRKADLVSSRIGPTDLLASRLATMDEPPATFISASAIGYYGHRAGNTTLTEDSAGGDGFLAELCRDWEEAAAPARDGGVRVVTARTGLVLAPSGGFLDRPLKLFRLGLGGRLGTGRQYWSWITLEDHVGAIAHLLASRIDGPVNLTAPTPATNAAFTKALGAQLHRPAFLPVPRFAIAAAFGGEMADEVVLAGQRVMPAALLDDGFSFGQRELPGALASILDGHA